MPAVQRVHPRHWDGHRLLQFLTGLALVTLAFGTPAAPASLPATAVTPTVEAPAAAARLAETPAAVDALAEAPAVTAGDRAAAVAAPASAPAAKAVASPASQAIAASAAQGAPARTSACSDECRHDASRTAHAVPAAADAATLAGITQPVHGSRAPPLR